MITARPSANVEAPPRFSWYDVPPQSKLKSAAAPRGDLLDARDRLAGADARRAPAEDLTAGRLLKRSSGRGPDEYLTVASADSGIISPCRSARRCGEVVGALRNCRLGRHQHLVRAAVLLKSFT